MANIEKTADAVNGGAMSSAHNSSNEKLSKSQSHGSLPSYSSADDRHARVTSARLVLLVGPRTDLTPAEKLLLLCLHAMGMDSTPTPTTHAWLAKISGLTERTIRRSLPNLIRAGLVTQHPGGPGEPNAYTLGGWAS